MAHSGELRGIPLESAKAMFGRTDWYDYSNSYGNKAMFVKTHTYLEERSEIVKSGAMRMRPPVRSSVFPEGDAASILDDLIPMLLPLVSYDDIRSTLEELRRLKEDTNDKIPGYEDKLRSNIKAVLDHLVSRGLSMAELHEVLFEWLQSDEHRKLYLQSISSLIAGQKVKERTDRHAFSGREF